MASFDGRLRLDLYEGHVIPKEILPSAGGKKCGLKPSWLTCCLRATNKN